MLSHCKRGGIAPPLTLKVKPVCYFRLILNESHKHACRIDFKNNKEKEMKKQPHKHSSEEHYSFDPKTDKADIREKKKRVAQVLRDTAKRLDKGEDVNVVVIESTATEEGDGIRTQGSTTVAINGINGLAAVLEGVDKFMKNARGLVHG